MTVAAVMASGSLIVAGPASAAVPAYACGKPKTYPINVAGDLGGVVAGDLNRDGFADVATANLASSSSVFLNNGRGGLRPFAKYSLADAQSNADGAQSPVLVDVNGDGKLDLVTANYYGKSISVLLGKRGGTFGPATTYATGRNPRRVVAGDFNGDGHVDLVARVDNGDSTHPGAQLLLGAGDGRFVTAPGSITLPSGTDVLVAGDFNGDGSPDLAAAVQNGSASVPSYGSVSVLLNRGDGRFQAQRSYGVDRFPVGITQSDVNSDGYPDIVTADVTDNSFSVLLNKGDGSGTFNPAISYSGAGGQFYPILADMNGDGLPDIAAGNPFGNNIMVLLNQGTGTFGAPISCNTLQPGVPARGPLYLAAADFNNDGKLDLVTANLSSGNNGPTISVLITP